MSLPCYFCTEISNTKTMERDNEFRGNVSLAVQAQRDPNMRVMRGKALLDAAVSDFKFVENEPRGPRSVEVGRTSHSRFVRRPDEGYTITFRVQAGEKYLRESLTAEVAELVKVISADAAALKAARMAAEKEAKNGEKKD